MNSMPEAAGSHDGSSSSGWPDFPGGGFFKVAGKGRVWRRIAHLLLTFPVGLVALVGLVAGIATGGGMLITLLGIPILVLTMLGWRYLARFERWRANALLGTAIPPLPFRREQGQPWQWLGLKSRLLNPMTWRSLLYVATLFPIGLAAFVAVVVLLSIPVGLATAPVFYARREYHIGGWNIDTLPEALLLGVAGILLFFVALHVLRGLSWLQRRYTELLLTSNVPEALDPGPNLLVRATAAVSAFREPSPARSSEAGHGESIEDGEPQEQFVTPRANDGVSVDVGMRLVTVGGRQVELTPKEFDLIALFVQNPGRPFSRDELLDKIWRNDYEVTDRTIDTHVQRLRKKLGDHADAIQTVWGVGYKFQG